MDALIFGVSGQDGFFIKQICEAKGLKAIGIARTAGEWMQGSISEFSFVEQLIKDHKPQFVFHLAANSTTRHDVLFENHESISTGTLNILESVKRYSPHSKVFITGSGVQFKNLGKAISESDDFEASSPYSVARIQSVYAARYFRSLGIKTYVGYLFHHESPLRKAHHVSKMIASAVKRIKAGSGEKITIGDLSVKKEWAYAKDIAEGIVALVEQEQFFEATIGTGEPFSIQDWLEVSFSLIDKNWEDFTIVEKQFKAEYPLLFSDPSTIHKCGWKHQTNLTELAKIMLR